MLQHNKAACLGSISAGPSTYAQLIRQRTGLHCRRALRAATAPQAINRSEFAQLVKTKSIEMHGSKKLQKQTSKIVELSNREFEEVVKAVFDTVVETVASGESVNLTGFGKFERRDRKARQGRNPKTQESMQLPATVAPGFTPGKAFKDTVKAKHVHT